MIPKQSFPKQCLTVCWRGFGVLPAPVGEGGSGEREWSSAGRSQDGRNKVLGGEGSHTHPSHSPALTPPGQEGPPFSGDPQAHSQGASTLLSVDLPVLGPSQAPQNQSPFKSRGPDPCPQSPGLPPPRTSHEGRTNSVQQGTEHTAWGGQGGGERDLFSSEFPSSLLPPLFLPSSHPSIHPQTFWWCCCSLFLSRYFLSFFFFFLSFCILRILPG